MKKPTKKMLEAAKQYLYANARFCAFDNSDDMHDVDKWEHTFDFLVDYKITVEDFIKTYLPSEISRAKDEVMESYERENFDGVFDSFDEAFGVS
jgi:hypothetical protein